VITQLLRKDHKHHEIVPEKNAETAKISKAFVRNNICVRSDFAGGFFFF
jgi:hypothetical protein